MSNFIQPVYKVHEVDSNKSILLKQPIYQDDTIKTIKLKIANEYGRTFSLEEIYLFGLKEVYLDPTQIYKLLSQNGKKQISAPILQSYLSNFKDESGNQILIDLKEKDFYEYDDILKLEVHDKKYIESCALGLANSNPITMNPFYSNSSNKEVSITSNKEVSITLDNELLLNYGELIDNTLYLCLAKNVLTTNKLINSTNLIKLYYPQLAALKIYSIDKLDEIQQQLIQHILLMDDVDVELFYNVYKERTRELPYVKLGGIKYIKLVIHPVYNVKIPLDIIFKLVHATKHSPFIKYNPAFKQEKIYRLFADNISKDGRKIPYLSKADILKYIKIYGKTKSVSIFIAPSILCEFEDNGNILISGDFEESMSIEEIEILFRESVNDIINEVKMYLEQSGYKIQLFNSIYDKSVEIKQLTYQSIIKIDKPIHIEPIIRCITSIFNVESSNIKKPGGIVLRYKRVANFNEATSQEAFIIDQINQKNKLEEIVKGLIDNFSLNQEEALNLITKISAELESAKKKVNIKMNPGFKTSIVLNQYNANIVVSVENINNIYYLQTIPVFLDTLIRLTQDKTWTNIPLEYINRLCSGKEKEQLRKKVNKQLIIEDQEEEKNLEEEKLEEEEEEKLEEEEEEEEQEQEEKLEQEEDDESIDETKIAKFSKLFDSDSDNESIASSTSKSASKVSSEGSLQIDLEPLDSLDSLSDVEEEGEGIRRRGKGLSKGLSKGRGKGRGKSIVKKKATIIIEEDEDLINIDNMNLTNPTPFYKKMEELEPTLFSSQIDGKFNTYSRACGSAARKQPILLTDDEVNEIEKVNGKFEKKDILKYGSNPDKQYNYICPRYWCLKTNMPLTDTQANDPKVCGKIIPRDASKVPKGAYVYEFFDKGEHGSQDNYIPHYPGFQKKNTDFPNKCFPCCFKTHDKAAQVKRKQECGQTKIKEVTVASVAKEEPIVAEEVETVAKEEPVVAEDVEPVAPVAPVVKEKVVKATIVEKDDYIKGPEKYPIEIGRWGYLPTSIQTFLHEVNLECQISKSNTNLKPNHACLLRHGVEFNTTQSFIACIADAKSYGSKIININSMKKNIIKMLTLDNFIRYQNGNLYTSFIVDTETVDISKYTNSNLYKKNNDPEYFKRVVASFENFINYLKNDSIIIDYTYLWDIICEPNPDLFKYGLNLIILEIVDNDTTNNVNFICPTNHYSTELYKSRRPSLFLIKHDDFFEPIYECTNKVVETKKIYKDMKWITNTTFTEDNPAVSKTIKAIFKKVIKPLMKTCLPKPSILPKDYKYKNIIFKHPILLTTLIAELNEIQYIITMQIVNFNNKVIGLKCEHNAEHITGFIPCYPSAILDKYDYIFMSDDTYNSYPDTLLFLNEVWEKSQERIPCKPRIKIIEDELIVGIITETNQFIQVSEPFPITHDDLIEIRDENYIIKPNYNEPLKKTDTIHVVDSILSSNEIDKDRTEYIKRLKLETNFYNVFRNTIRILLNDYKNIELREKIEKELDVPTILYANKLDTIHKILKEISNEAIRFIENDDFNTDAINEIYTCIINDIGAGAGATDADATDATATNKDTCSEKAPLCVIAGSVCQILLPMFNLLNLDINNETLYFNKMADEIIRYTRIRSYMFQPQSFLSFSHLEYNVRDDELIIIEPLLLEYFNGLILENNNQYSKNTNFDTVIPIKTIPYDNEVDSTMLTNIDKQIEIKKPDEPIELMELMEPMEPEPIEPIEPIKVLEPCTIKQRKKITSDEWRECFPSNYTENSYDKLITCGYQLLIDIIQQFKEKRVTYESIKEELLEEYAKYLPKYEMQLVDILISEGKLNIGKNVKNGYTTFQQMIVDESYAISNLDLWIMMEKYAIPSILISSRTILQTNSLKKIFTLVPSSTDEYIFIVTSAQQIIENILKYNLILDEERNMVISLSHVTSEPCLKNIAESVAEWTSVKDYLKSYIIKTKTYYAKKGGPKPVLVIEEGPSLVQLPEEDVQEKDKKTRKVRGVNKKAVTKKLTGL